MSWCASRVQLRGDPIQRQHAQHMPDRHARLAGFDARDGLHMHAQSGRGGGLAVTGFRARELRSRAHLLDRQKRVA